MMVESNLQSGAVTGSVESVPVLGIQEFQREVAALLAQGWRLASFFGSPTSQPEEVNLNAVLLEEVSGGVRLLRSRRLRQETYRSLTPEFPAIHCFERECFEQYGVRPFDHPWLKPIRYPASGEQRLESYPFKLIDGKEIHEVGVGPIHAGVIEPGHFRFLCYGETVHHLEIQLGFQHRDAEGLLLRGDPLRLAPLVETLSGDSSIAHTWAYCRAIEALSDTPTASSRELVRGLALELERVAMHLAGLAGIATDIAFLPGGTTYGRLRTTAINTSMRLCGSRFGRGWLRPGEVRCDLSPAVIRDSRAALLAMQEDLAPVNELFLASHTVRHRLQGTGIVSRKLAHEMGFVGMSARMSGLSLDLRKNSEPYSKRPIDVVSESDGDCWARARLRIREIDASLRWILGVLDLLIDGTAPEASPPKALRPRSFAFSMVEGWRGEVFHYLETDDSGKLAHYKAQDPSLRNWFALALALRGNAISDFPVCNKSFDLSYCGQDL